ncbi:hypothetical protein CMEL01_00684 [Colletotrichum melonis]|uniref:Uncharacterized protein n=1 Tax=Colletotrichum melonis TaxID=1209925 RepID=A0AAI9V1M8_9PEZI|nr:hypothetical protein CMEL01_00684 [Colletotrichum melonis]
MQKRQRRSPYPSLPAPSPPLHPVQALRPGPEWRRRRFFFRSWLLHHATQSTTPGTRNKEGARGTARRLSSPRAGALSGAQSTTLYPIGLLRCRYVRCGPGNVCQNVAYLRIYEPEDTAFTHVHVASALLTSFPES